MPYPVGYAVKASRLSPERMRPRDIQRELSAQGHGGCDCVWWPVFISILCHISCNQRSMWRCPAYAPCLHPEFSACSSLPPEPHRGQLCWILYPFPCGTGRGNIHYSCLPWWDPASQTHSVQLLLFSLRSQPFGPALEHLPLSIQSQLRLLGKVWGVKKNQVLLL